MGVQTTVHMLRHGEVHNPTGVLYGRRDGFHLSELGTTMAQRIAETVGDRDIVHMRTSPLERARETGAPLASVPHTVQVAGTMFSVFFREGSVRDFAEASQQDTAAYAAFFHSMLDQGVYLPPSAYEAWFVSAAHDDRAVSTIIDALPAAALAAATAGGH